MLHGTPGTGPKNSDCPSKIGGRIQEGTPKLYKEGKNRPRVCARKRRVLVLNSYPDPTPHPFQNPVSAPENEDSWQPLELL